MTTARTNFKNLLIGNLTKKKKSIKYYQWYIKIKLIFILIINAWNRSTPRYKFYREENLKFIQVLDEGRCTGKIRLERVAYLERDQSFNNGILRGDLTT